ncbi:MAG TPA: hypothetical protein VGQ65_01330 [Thermoanaerobaculia bacterium]|jgi:hypothetical protein|nr:hypothetical protein [Thermoanaerobaculia bacterium]
MPGKKSLLTFAIALVIGTAARLVADCSSAVAVQAPPSACKSGTATVAVAAVPGATYAWTVDGGTIIGDAAGDHITIALGTKTTATASVTVIAGSCTSHGSGVIALHDPFAVRTSIPEAGAGMPLTIQWNYENGSPARQTISGSDFGVLTLPAGARSYTYTPATSGSKQIVIDAAMQTASESTPATRRRAAAKSPAAASPCAELRTTIPYSVSECLRPNVSVDAPTSVVAGTPFLISVIPQPNAIATWTIFNGSPETATGDSVMVTPGTSGAVQVSVQLTRGSCWNETARSIAIVAKPVCNNPKAAVVAGPISCGSAVVSATFTGTPPFRGTWSDGTPFNTNAPSITRTVTIPGNYSIASFEDAACAGTSSGVAVLPVLGPTATISGQANGCVGVDSVTVKFTGKPPFSGRWTDDTSFVTNDMEIVKPLTAPGLTTLQYGYDGTDCRLSVTGDVVAQVTPKIVKMETFCQSPDFNNVMLVGATFNGFYTLPLTVNWSDGTTTTYASSPVWRILQPQPNGVTYTVVSAHDAYCSAVIESPSITIPAAVIPDFSLGIGNICTGATAAASLISAPPPDAQVTWYAQNATILSGQGTSSIQYTAGDVGSMDLGCILTFPDGRCPTTHRQTVAVKGDPNGTIALAKTEIHVGETVGITIVMNSNVWYWSLDDTLNDPITMIPTCGADGSPCQYVYTSSHAGKSTITLHLTGFCPETKEVSIDLNVLP